jgi:L-lactate dehydrogenase complex protein LldG
MNPDVRSFIDRLRRDMPARDTGTDLPALSHDLREIDAVVDLAACFTTAAIAAACDVRRATADDWPAIIAGIAKEHAATRVLVEPQPGTALTAPRAAALTSALQAAGIDTVTARDDDTLFEIPLAVTGVVGAVAETGSLIVESSPAAARGSTLIPPIHVAVLTPAQIVPDLFDWFDRIDTARPLAANHVFITGPSKTADIEGILIRGVHGPGHVHVVVLPDDAA